MPCYEIEVYELWMSKFVVEGDNAADAVQNFRDGDGDSISNSSQYIEMADNYGGDRSCISTDPDIKRELLDTTASLAGIYSVEPGDC